MDNKFPDTAINSRPPKKTRKKKATFRFSSPDSDVIGFQCKLDKKAWTSCNSGKKTYKVLSRKKHTFLVRAIGSAGAAIDADTTPAKRTWTVKKKRRR